MITNKIYPSADFAIRDLGLSLIGPEATTREPNRWQGLPIDQSMIEVFDTFFRVRMPQTPSGALTDCDPDMPWAEEHFKERIYGDPKAKEDPQFEHFGRPTNPGVTFKDWPYYKEGSYREGGIFSHTYQERFWPFNDDMSRKTGLRYSLGCFQDVVNHLYEHPDSRQAYFPIWFPEDTGVRHKGRVPCSLGYLFSFRDGYLHLSYDLRSCDYIRHFKNDIYFAIRLAQEFLRRMKIREANSKTVDPNGISWSKVCLGTLTFHITSLHIFESDQYELNKRLKKLCNK